MYMCQSKAILCSVTVFYSRVETVSLLLYMYYHVLFSNPCLLLVLFFNVIYLASI